jgi:hypothetical protein
VTLPDRALRGSEPCPRARSRPDWDAMLTFGLTLLVSLFSLGIANLLALRRVLAATLGRLAIESWFYLWFNVGKHWAKATGNRRMLERVT